MWPPPPSVDVSVTLITYQLDAACLPVLVLLCPSWFPSIRCQSTFRAGVPVVIVVRDDYHPTATPIPQTRENSQPYWCSRSCKSQVIEPQFYKTLTTPLIYYSYTNYNSDFGWAFQCTFSCTWCNGCLGNNSEAIGAMTSGPSFSTTLHSIRKHKYISININKNNYMHI